MERLKEKLRGRGGASMLMALLFLLLAVSGSAVLLPAALTAQQRVADDHGYEQSYLTVSSAAALLRSGIAGEEFCIRVTSRFGAEESTEYLGGGELHPLLERAVRWVRAYAAPLPDGKESGRFRERLTVTAEGFAPVTVDFTMDGAYRITMEFSEENGCRLTMELDCARRTEIRDGVDENGVPTAVEDTCLSWGGEEP